MLQLKKFPDIPISTREEAREFRPHPEVPRFRLLLERRDLSLRGGERIPRVPVAFQEEALSTGKARGTPRSCHHSQSPPVVSVHSRENCFPCTASISCRGSTHTTVARGTALWESLVRKPRGKASRESHRSLDPREGKRDTAAKAREERARACPHSRRGLTPLGRLQSSPRSMSALERNPQVPAPTPHKVLGLGFDGRGIPRGPRATRMGTGLS